MDELAQFKTTYFEECADLLQTLESRLLDLIPEQASRDDLDAIFRAVHSIKGGAGAFGFDHLVDFSHVFETLLDALREGRRPLTRETLQILIRSADILADLVQMAQGDQTPAADFGAEVRTQLVAVTEGDAAPVPAPAPAPAPTPPVTEEEGDGWGLWLDDDTSEPEPAPATVAEVTLYRITFNPRPEMLRNANEPVLIVRELRSLGVVRVTVDTGALPPLDQMTAEDSYLSWVIEVETDAPLAMVEEVFEFVAEDCDLSIKAEAGLFDAPEPAAAPAPVPAPAPAPVPEPAPTAIPAPSPVPDPAPPAEMAPPAETAPLAAAREAPVATAPSSIRVDLEKVDRLVNMVGELVITQAMLAQQGQHLPVDTYPALIQGLEELSQHTRELQENVMAIRAQPVKSVFARMPRVVREVAAAVGKEVRLVTAGEGTEVDKTVIEQLADPLTHMVRNAVDHGIEAPEVRAAAGKRPEGTIHLVAEHRGGRIVIELADDGGGIPRDKVRERAVARGLVPADVALSDEEIDQLIFMPGFSTAENVSNISGRGVGMDVVRRNIQDMGGRVTVQSTPGQGTRMILSLPLTLAVMDGMVVSVGGERYVLPLTNIIESLRPAKADIRRLSGGAEVLAMRGDYIRLVPLHRLFGIQRAVREPWNGLVVVAEAEAGDRIGILVDEMLGQQQVVLKSLESNYRPVEGVSAATILGDGRVALILDIHGLKTFGRGRPMTIDREEARA